MIDVFPMKRVRFIGFAASPNGLGVRCTGGWTDSSLTTASVVCASWSPASGDLALMSYGQDSWNMTS